LLFGREPIGNGIDFNQILASMGVAGMQLDSGASASDEETKAASDEETKASIAVE